jgi:hypothetical protein
MSEIGQKIIAETRKVAAETPGFVYRGLCQYVDGGRPACLIGHALWNLGLIDETLEHLSVNDDAVRFVTNHLDIALDEAEESWLNLAQSRQDNGFPWGTSVVRADERWKTSLS